jgi:hypothetical protein
MPMVGIPSILSSATPMEPSEAPRYYFATLMPPRGSLTKDSSKRHTGTSSSGVNLMTRTMSSSNEVMASSGSLTSNKVIVRLEQSPVVLIITCAGRSPQPLISNYHLLLVDTAIHVLLPFMHGGHPCTAAIHVLLPSMYCCHPCTATIHVLLPSMYCCHPCAAAINALLPLCTAVIHVLLSSMHRGY